MSSEFGKAPIMTIREVAEGLQVCQMTVYRMIKAGKLPAFKIGGGWRIRKEEFDKMVNCKVEVIA